MNTNNLKKSAVSGVFWKFGERILAQGVSFVVSLVLARLLMPEDFGVISIITIFITIANVFVSDGFSSALIQKKDTDRLDYSSVLIGGFGVSLVLYAIIYVFSPPLADFYNMPVLSPALRVLALRLPLAAINSVECAYLSKKLEFKKFFWATFIGTAGSAIVGIYMAYSGYGVWALVGQNLFNYTVDIIILAIAIHKLPPLRFSISRLKSLMSFGYKILLTNLFFNIINQLRAFIIGKKYSSADLAFYSKGKHFPELISTNISGPISSVLFPTMSKLQSDISAVKNVMRKSVLLITLVVSPILLGFAAVSEPLVKLLLTDKWLPCVTYIWIGCIYYLFVPIHGVNLEAVKAIGKGDAVFNYGVFKRVVGIITLLVAIPFGVTAIAWSLVVSAVLSTIINAYQNKRLFDYSYKEQICDMLPNMFCSGIMSIAVFGIGQILNLGFVVIPVQILAGIALYLLLIFIFRRNDFKNTLDMIRQIIKK